MLQFSELRDTKTEEYVTSLYLKGITKHVYQNVTDHKLFLIPKRIHLVVIGEADAIAKKDILRLLEDTVIDILVYADGYEEWTRDQLPRAERIICLEDPGVVRTIIGKSRWHATGSGRAGRTSVDVYKTEAAGWKFTVRYCGCGKTALFQDPAVDNSQNSYADCVMSVKNVCGGKACIGQETPDGYGCAMGCALHQDYDACRYRYPEGTIPSLTGMILLPEAVDGNAWGYLKEEIMEKLPGVRFFMVSDEEDFSMLQGMLMSQEQQKPACKRYFIGSDVEVSDELIASVVRSSQYHVPVVLKEGQSICCSGFLKYAQE
jgi:hypothetical protein